MTVLRTVQSVDNTTSVSVEFTSPAARKFVVLMQRSSGSAVPPSWLDWMWSVCWPALALIYLMELNVLQPFYLVIQAVFPARHFFTWYLATRGSLTNRGLLLRKMYTSSPTSLDFWDPQRICQWNNCDNRLTTGWSSYGENIVWQFFNGDEKLWRSCWTPSWISQLQQLPAGKAVHLHVIAEGLTNPTTKYTFYSKLVSFFSIKNVGFAPLHQVWYRCSLV